MQMYYQYHSSQVWECEWTWQSRDLSPSLRDAYYFSPLSTKPLESVGTERAGTKIDERKETSNKRNSVVSNTLGVKCFTSITSEEYKKDSSYLSSNLTTPTKSIKVTQENPFFTSLDLGVSTCVIFWSLCGSDPYLLFWCLSVALLIIWYFGGFSILFPFCYNLILLYFCHLAFDLARVCVFSLSLTAADFLTPWRRHTALVCAVSKETSPCEEVGLSRATPTQGWWRLCVRSCCCGQSWAGRQKSKLVLHKY